MLNAEFFLFDTFSETTKNMFSGDTMGRSIGREDKITLISMSLIAVISKSLLSED